MFVGQERLLARLGNPGSPWSHCGNSRGELLCPHGPRGLGLLEEIMSSLITIFKFLKKFIRLMKSISRFKCSQNIASLNVLVMLTVVHDILEIIKRGKVEALTDHLNGIDKTNSIKFTHEPEKNGQIPFLDTLITRREDGSI